MAAAGWPAADPRQELLNADRAFDRDTAVRGLEGWMSWFASDAQINPPGGPVQGTEALRAYYAKMFAREGFSLRWQPFFAEVSRDGTLGYTLGTAQLSYRDKDGQVVKRETRYLTVWRKRRDGVWRVVSDMGN
jgi:ketosteroid isomerase-like protein